MTFVFGFVISQKCSVLAENKMTFSAPVSLSAENVYTGFGRSLGLTNRNPELQQMSKHVTKTLVSNQLTRDDFPNSINVRQML